MQLPTLMALALAWGTGTTAVSPLSPVAASPLFQPVGHPDATLLTRRWRYRFNVRASRYRRGGISRGEECPTDIISSVTPPIEQALQSDELPATAYLGTSAHPTFFIFSPQLPETTVKLTLSYDDEARPAYETTLYEVEYTIDGQSGIVGLTTPETVPPLEVGQQYQWEVAAFCAPNSEDPLAIDDSMILTGGVIERVAETAAGSPQEQLDSYLEAGIWQEALTLVAQTYYQNPDDPAAVEDWEGLMEAAGLAQLKAVPVVTIAEGTVLWTANAQVSP